MVCLDELRCVTQWYYLLHRRVWNIVALASLKTWVAWKQTVQICHEHLPLSAYMYARFALSEDVAYVMKIIVGDSVYSHPLLNATSCNHSNDEVFFFLCLSTAAGTGAWQSTSMLANGLGSARHAERAATKPGGLREVRKVIGACCSDNFL